MLHAVKASAQTTEPSEYLSKVLRLTGDLWQAGGRLMARTQLDSALSFTTANGRSVPPGLHIDAALDLARMQAQDHQLRDAVGTLVAIKQVAEGMDDASTQKIRYFRLLASVALTAGYFRDGSKAAQEALRLLSPGSEREEVGAELAEARFLEGQPSPIVEISEGEA